MPVHDFDLGLYLFFFFAFSFLSLGFFSLTLLDILFDNKLGLGLRDSLWESEFGFK